MARRSDYLALVLILSFELCDTRTVAFRFHHTRLKHFYALVMNGMYHEYYFYLLTSELLSIVFLSWT